MSFSIKNSMSSFSSFWFMWRPAGMVAFPGSQFHQVLGRGSKDIATAVRDHDHVFDANATASGDVDTGLDGYHHAGLKLILLGPAQPRRLMDFQADAVAGGMGEVPRQPGAPKGAASRLIHVAAAYASAYSLDRRLLRLPHRLVHFAVGWGTLPHVHSASHVRTVTVEYNTEVEHDESAPWYARSRSVAVRQSGARAGGDDGVERHAVRASEAGRIFKLGRNVAFRSTGLNGLESRLEQMRAEFDGGANCVELAGILNDTKLLDNCARVAEGRPGAEGAPEGGMSGDGETLAFDADLAHAMREQPLRRGKQSGTLGDDHARADDLFPGLLRIAAVRKDSG